MKVISANEMARIETMAFSEGASDWEFMEQAGAGAAKIVEEYIQANSLAKFVTILCGKGNNAGDGYVVARLLQKKGYQIKVYHLFPIENCSPLCQENYHLFKGEEGDVTFVERLGELEFPKEGVLIDALLGTGFKGAVTGVMAWVIVRANESGLPILSIDIPSGLNGNTGVVERTSIQADTTIFLGLPKTGFFIEDGWNCVGKLRFVDFGLDLDYIQHANPDFILLSKENVAPLLPRIHRSRHKYSAGYVVGLSGSKLYSGAPILSGWSCLRSGAGIVRIFHPEDAVLAHQPYELIKETYKEGEEDRILKTMNTASSVFMGPGTGTQAYTKRLLLKACRELDVPCVLDADALNVLAEEKHAKLPKCLVMTPHMGEMRRLLGVSEKEGLSIHFIAQCQNYVNEKRVTLILKGGPSFIFHPYTKPMVNPFGNPGMATAGTGDVLTGMVSAFLAQGLTPRNAAMVSLFLHSIAGDSVAQQKTEYALIASDLIERIPVAFRSVLGVNVLL